MGSLTFRVARTVSAGVGGALRWLAMLLVMAVITLPLVRGAATWFVQGRIDLAPFEPTATSPGSQRLDVSGGSASEIAAVRSAYGRLRYHVRPHSFGVVIVDEDPSNQGVAGEYLPYLNVVRLNRAVVDMGGMQLSWTAAHELGHYVDQRYLDDAARKRYRELRGIPAGLSWEAADSPWQQRPDEDFAEVFASLCQHSAVMPPMTGYGPVRHPVAFEELLAGRGVVLGKDPPAASWHEALGRQMVLVWDTLTDGSLRLPLLIVVTAYMLAGGIPAARRAWHSPGHPAARTGPSPHAALATTDPAHAPPLVVALSGSTVGPGGDRLSVEMQQEHLARALANVADLIATGRRLVLTHGSASSVGNLLECEESARQRIAPMPLWLTDADCQGGLGSMLELELRDLLEEREVKTDVVTVTTHVLVDPSDPAFRHPDKPIGPPYPPDRARVLEATEGWTFDHASDTAWRHVVPSPKPQRIVERGSIRTLLKGGRVVIAAGGGGVPVVREPDRTYHGVDAVIDHDAAAELLAEGFEDATLVLLMEEDAVYLDYGTRDQRTIQRLTADQARKLIARGAFQGHSIGPKVAAAARFARHGGEAVICSAGELPDALRGRAGTRFVG